MSNSRPRPSYTQTALPPYSYVPGHAPHPVSDPRGHMHGQLHVTAPPLDPARWHDSEAYRYGFDLFNHGFYWEAHEAWESLWHAARRTGVTANWLKALIKLAAATVKLREGNAAGAVRHARRSRELLNEVRDAISRDAAIYAGVELHQIDELIEELVTQANKSGGADPLLLLDHWIELAPGR